LFSAAQRFTGDIPAMSQAVNTVAEGRANKQLIETLLRSRLFRDYETVFTKATGLALTLRPREYWQLAHHGKKNENPFCARLAEHPGTLAVCLQAHEQMIQHTGDLPHTVTCPFGLTETAVPVKLGSETIGFLRIGQVLRRSPTSADTKKLADKVESYGLSFTQKLREAWENNPLIPPERYGGMVRLLTFFADQLSALINQIVVEQQNTEPPLVQKARDYIVKHKGERLTLAAVAQAAGTSVFHFCKVFHKSTGLKFTDYVARVRLEDARTQLLNPNRRISEVAYDVGFQSLTQFNRTFKRVFGQSPTEFRLHVSADKGGARISERKKRQAFRK
jgi:AraC-like DNA-binding protein/ligand-binding sensor protein